MHGKIPFLESSEMAINTSGKVQLLDSLDNFPDNVWIFIDFKIKKGLREHAHNFEFDKRNLYCPLSYCSEPAIWNFSLGKLDKIEKILY